MLNDSLYRISLKCLIVNDGGDILVVKESGRDFWDLPGGGMDHGEGIETAIARELMEEVNYGDSFSYTILTLDEPAQLLTREVWQMRIILNVLPTTYTFSAGVDADEVAFINPLTFKDSHKPQEQKIFQYSTMLQ